MQRGHLTEAELEKYWTDEESSEEDLLWYEEARAHTLQCAECQANLSRMLEAELYADAAVLGRGLEYLADQEELKRKLLLKKLEASGKRAVWRMIESMDYLRERVCVRRECAGSDVCTRDGERTEYRRANATGLRAVTVCGSEAAGSLFGDDAGRYQARTEASFELVYRESDRTLCLIAEGLPEGSYTAAAEPAGDVCADVAAFEFCVMSDGERTVAECGAKREDAEYLVYYRRI